MKQLTVTEMAELLKISRTAVLKKITNKKLPSGYTAQKVGSSWIITKVV